MVLPTVTPTVSSAAFRHLLQMADGGILFALNPIWLALSIEVPPGAAELPRAQPKLGWPPDRPRSVPSHRLSRGQASCALPPNPLPPARPSRATFPPCGDVKVAAVALLVLLLAVLWAGCSFISRASAAWRLTAPPVTRRT
ncbi:MAG: hypothetical protein WDO24_23650 [Pseudomonadota bacterium]